MTQQTVKAQFKSADFVHLHNHSHYSLLDGLQKVPEMLDRVQELGMHSVALTDHGTLSGSIQFYKEATERGIKPIIGIETYVAPRSHQDKEGKADANPYHLILLAMNNTGYQNLMKLSTIANLDGFYYKPRVDHALLEKYNEGLIVLSGCMGGEVADALQSNEYARAQKIASWYKSIFGDRYYIELQDHAHEWPQQAKVNDQLLKLAKELGVQPVVTADAHYCVAEDQNAHEVLLCVQTGSNLDDEGRMSLKDMHLFVSDPAEMAARWRASPEVMTNTKAVADRCQIDIEFGKILIPKFITPTGVDEKEFLETEAHRGAAWRYGQVTRPESKKLSNKQALATLSKEVAERLRFELDTIHDMGLSGYFLIVADFINWAKDKGIIIGPGRGSAAGSLVSYALNITDLEPLQYDLLFERFLNPERISMPDIDIDFQDDRRDEVIAYVVDKYGADRVAHIATFGTMAARNAIRDTARVLNMSYSDADRLAKMVPPPVQGRHVSLKKHIDDVADLKHEYQNNPEAKKVMDLAIRLEGTIRSHGVHAAGVVIAPDEITKFTPLEMAQKGVVATQYSMNPIESLGLLKMDFLGLSNLTIINNALRIIRKVYQKDIDITQIPLDDAKTYALLAKGDTTGVFQLESAGMKRYIKQLKPGRLEDIIAMVALYRPGPMQWIDDFLARKNRKKAIEYMHPKMQDALETTYGVIVYQEQVMQISKDLCGFSGAQADTLRKAIGKKIPEMLAKQKDAFIEGAIKTSNVERKLVENLWKSLEDFAAYAFPKAHAACYALIAYQTAYLKAHYPAAFMAALMTSDHGDTDRIAIEINECRRMGIEVLPPDVNESFVEFAVRPTDNAIRFGMAAIKNVGKGAVERILEAREAGKFKSIEDFAKRASAQTVNKKVWESLIKTGAFDSLGDRSELLYNLESIVAFASRLHKEATAGQTDLFGGTKIGEDMLPKLQFEPGAEFSERESLGWERSLLGVYLTKHPLEEYKEQLGVATTAVSQITHAMEGQSVSVGGYVSEARKITTRGGKPMAFVKIEDLGGELELIVFPGLFESSKELWEPDQVVLVSGKVNTKDRDGRTASEIKILADSAEALTDESLKKWAEKAKDSKRVNTSAQNVPQKTPKNTTKQLVIRLPSEDDLAKLAQLKAMLSKHPGSSEVMIMVGKDANTKIKLPFTVDLSNGLQAELEGLLSKEAVVIS